MASRSVNKVILIGRLGKDAESKFTPSGTSVSTFSIATSWRQKDQQTGEWKDHTDWHNIVFWRAENVAPYLLKGTQVYIEGRLQTRNYENKEGKKVYVTEVVAEELILLGGRQGGGDASGEYSQQQPVSMPRSAQRPAAAAPATPAPAEDPGFDQGITDDDVPF
jgi:single-strand DNA-binding protein